MAILYEQRLDYLTCSLLLRENMKHVYESPDVVVELERQKEQNKLLQMISTLKKEKEKLSAHNEYAQSFTY